MTVKELIEVLSKHDQTLPVYLVSLQDDTGDSDELLTPAHIDVADPDEVRGYLMISHSKQA